MDTPNTVSLTSASLASAFWVAALAVAGKVAYDSWTGFDQRRGVAAARAGEIGAYVEIIMEADLPTALSGWTNIPVENREVVFRAISPLPVGHPVFDKIADKLALLPLEQSVGIS